ncbi:nSTAND1 domain-containing NTPase [Streptomyces viridosporus]|uniref:nSTAND1 domain-containing NTPase n=1 Tax=Streptomyces viridosporus TaxID=67581 RepID=UPI0009BF56AD|nr:helix-turn-helix domain-containing protein [Streptomyces viridosporus]
MQRFAFELRKLRTEAGGITYRVLAQRAGYGVTTLSQAAAGEQLPTLPVVLAYVEACGGDLTEWEARWKQAVEEASASSSKDEEGGGAPPYRGLARFEPGDSGRFFGRDKLTSDVLELVRRRRFAAVFGASGSGKSSLLRAGLIPALRHTQDAALRPAAIRILTPGQHPTRTHAPVLDTSPRTDSARADVFVIVDQFEETFTLCGDPAERAAFIDLLLTAQRPENRLRVLLAVRADFYGRCVEHPGLADALSGAHLLVGPMSPTELRAAIVKPAADAGLTVERALTSRLVNEVAEAPGGLPLLSHVLLETWRRRRGKTMTLTGYEAAGGLEGAVAKTAEEVYGQFTDAEAVAARRLLLRLVAPGDGTPDTRRPADREELETPDRQETAEVVEALTRARLLTLDGDTVDLAHEALLTAWPRLHGWIEQDRERLRAHRKLTEAARVWEELGRDPGALYRGSRLATAQEHFSSPDDLDDLTGLEQDFLTASTTARQQEQHSATRTTRRLRRLRVGLSLMMALACVAGAIAWQQSESEKRERLEVEARRIAALAESLRVTDPVTAMRLSIASWTLADLPESRSALMSAAVQKEQDAFTDPDTDPAAVRYLSDDGRTLVSAGAKQAVAWDVRSHRRIASSPGLSSSLAHAGVMSPDLRKLTLVDDDGRVRIWDVRTGRVDGQRLPADDGAEISPSGRTFVLYRTLGLQAVFQLRDMRTRRVLLERRMDNVLPKVGPGEPIDVPAWALRRLRQQRRMNDYPLPDAQVSADDRVMALCLPGTRLQIWDIRGRRKLPTEWAPKTTAANCSREDFQFTPDSRHLVLRGPAGVRRWEIASGLELPKLEHEGLEDLAFSPDGRFMAATDPDEILLWRTDAPAAPVFRYPLSGETVSELRLDMEERRIRYFAGRSQIVVRSLSLDGVVDSRWQSRPAVSASFSPDGSTLAIAHQDTDTGQAHIQLFDGRNGTHMASPPPAACPTPPEGRQSPAPCPVHMAFRPDRRILAYGVSHPTNSIPPEKLSLWEVPAHRITDSLTVTRTDPDIAGLPANAVNGIAFHPDGTSLMTSRIPADERLEIWNLRNGDMTREIPDIGGEILAVKPGGRILATNHGQFLDLRSGRITRRALTSGVTTALAFSPDGKYLAAGDESGQVTVWDGDAHEPLGLLPASPVRDGKPRHVSALAFSPDGHTLAAAGDDGTLRLWDTDSGRSIGSALPTPGTAILALAFSPDDKTLYAAGKHIPLQTYDITTGQAATLACDRAGAGLTPGEWSTHIRDIPYLRTC